MKEIDVDKIFHKRYGNLFLTDKQVEILSKYNIDFNKFKNTNELIYYLEYYLNYQQLEDLDLLSEELSEFEYYNNTNK